MRISISYRALLSGLLVVVVLLGGYFLVDWLVVTDSERIHLMLDEAARAAERHDINYIVDQCLDADFRLGTLDREKTRAWGKSVLETVDVISVRDYTFEAKVNGDSAQAKLRTFVKTARIGVEQRMDWEFELRRRDRSHWGITAVRAFYFLGGERHELPLADVQRYVSHL